MQKDCPQARSLSFVTIISFRNTSNLTICHPRPGVCHCVSEEHCEQLPGLGRGSVKTHSTGQPRRAARSTPAWPPHARRRFQNSWRGEDALLWAAISCTSCRARGLPCTVSLAVGSRLHAGLSSGWSEAVSWVPSALVPFPAQCQQLRKPTRVVPKG